MGRTLAGNETLLAEARRARQEMEYMLQAVAHDLRSPLTVASGYVRMLRDGTINPPSGVRAHPLEIVEEKLAECRRLVNELLVASRRDAAAVPARAVVNLSELAERAVDRAWPRALLIGAHLAAETPKRAVPAHGDAADVDRILNNLLANALEHGGERPQVTVAVGHDHGPFISVSDRGRGVPPRDRERIFDRFVRGTASSGAGLGLHLSRRLAEAGGGSLTLDGGNEGPGARFILRLPEPAVAPAHAAA
ncbi:MAG: HAMP domain-containing histidine kinase [Candidatus Dormibacteraeota bacterium]|nr:HAMP domain-containing histidine kinase [Candidatus Dormibacteraeota bacterium]